MQRYDRLRATPIEHGDDEKTVELESADYDYLSSRSAEELKQWLEQHQIRYSQQSKEGLIRLIKRMFTVITPRRVMPKFKMCPKTAGKRATLKFVNEEEEDDVNSPRIDQDDGFQKRLIF